MVNEKSLTLVDKKSNQGLLEYKGEGGNPYRKRFILRRINCQDLYLDDNERKQLLQILNDSKTVVTLGEITISLVGFIEITPRWASDNPPPRPRINTMPIWDDELQKPIITNDPQDEEKAQQWDEVFGEQL